MAIRRKPEPKRSPRRHRQHIKPPSATGYTLDPGQRAALEKKYVTSWQQSGLFRGRRK